MSNASSGLPQLPEKENWGSRLGVVLAVAGSAVGLGNFLRFPGQAVNNGGGAFMIPYIISFLLLGIPIAWCEWTMGRLGGRFGQNSAPGIFYAIWRRTPAKALGAFSLLIPIAIYMYYILLEAWCLDYCLFFIQGGFADLFNTATQSATGQAAEAGAVVDAASDHRMAVFGSHEHGSLFTGGRTIWLVLICFLVNFVIIYQGILRGIEKFCKWAMPLLVMCAVIILVRVLTLPHITIGLGFMWNPQWHTLKDPQVWLAAAGQIFFSLSVGFGLILCYSSYLRKDDDVVLTSLSASSTNEFCEVILAGLIVVPTAFLFLGAENAKGETFALGFVTIPAIMHFMPHIGSFFGALWFGLLFLAAVTSSLSMLQPAIAFLEDGFGLGRRASVAILGVITAMGATLTMVFSKGSLAMDYTDFWCNLFMIVAATGLVIMFGWIVGAERGVKELNRGADFRVPRVLAIVIRYVTPTFLIVILAAWCYDKLPDRLEGMSPEKQARKTMDATVTAAMGLREQLAEILDTTTISDDDAAVEMAEILPAVGDSPQSDDLLAWVHQTRADAAAEALGDDQKRQEFFRCALIRRFGLPPKLSDEDNAAVIAGILAEAALTPRELAGKILRHAADCPEKPEPDRLAAFITAVRAEAADAGEAAIVDANVARFVFLGIILFLLLLYVTSDVACRNRIGRVIAQAEQRGVDWEVKS